MHAETSSTLLQQQHTKAQSALQSISLAAARAGAVAWANEKRFSQRFPCATEITILFHSHAHTQTPDSRLPDNVFFFFASK